MQALWTIVIAVVAALAGRWAAGSAVHRENGPGGGPGAPELRAELQQLRALKEDLAREIARRESELAAAPAPDGEVAEAEIAAALERWRAAHPAEARHAAEAKKPAPDAGELDLAQVPIEELVRQLSRTGLGNRERQELFQRLREAGRIDEYVAKVEELAAANPNDPELQAALGNAYLQKLFGVDSGPERGVWANKADAAFDRALALDDHNWGARFTKAVSLSNWPAFLGRGPEAISNLEELLDQQSEVPPRPEFALTYLFLGNIYQANGEPTKALATWREGLRQFPDVEELRKALALAEANGGR